MQILRNQVLNAVREKILQRQLRPGERLVERELAAELGVSRTPIRECFRVLELEGLVENIAGHGVFVRQISGREVSESLEVRSALDALAVALAAERRTEEDLVHLEAALRLFDLALASGDDKRIMAADSRFHDAIYQAAHNTVLLTVRDAFALYEGFYFHPDFYRYNEDAFRRSLQRHTEMAEAIRSRQPAEAERISRQHLTEALELVREDTEAATPQEKE